MQIQTFVHLQKMLYFRIAVQIIDLPEPLDVTDTTIKLGQTMPYSGPASAYSAIGRAEARYTRSGRVALWLIAAVLVYLAVVASVAVF